VALLGAHHILHISRIRVKGRAMAQVVFVAGLSKRRTELDLGPLRVTFVVSKVALELVLLRVLRFCPVSTFLSVLQTHVLNTMSCSLYPGAF